MEVGTVGTESVDSAETVELSEAVGAFPTRSELTPRTVTIVRLPWRGRGGRDGRRHVSGGPGKAGGCGGGLRDGGGGTAL